MPTLYEQQKQRLLDGVPAGEGPLFREGDALKLRFDAVQITNERKGARAVFMWRGEVVSTRDLSYCFQEGDTLTLNGFDAVMEVTIE